MTFSEKSLKHKSWLTKKFASQQKIVTTIRNRYDKSCGKQKAGPAGTVAGLKGVRTLKKQNIASSGAFGNADIHDIEAYRWSRERYRWLNMVLRHPGLTDSAKVVASAILQFVHRDRSYAWVGHEKLGEAVGRCEKTVRTAIKKLEAAGYLRVDRRGGGAGRTCEYRLKVPEENPVKSSSRIQIPGKIETKTRQLFTEDTEIESLKGETEKEKYTVGSGEIPTPVAIVDIAAQAESAVSEDEFQGVVVATDLSQARSAISAAIGRLLGEPPGAGRAVFDRMADEVRARLRSAAARGGVPVGVLVAEMKRAGAAPAA